MNFCFNKLDGQFNISESEIGSPYSDAFSLETLKITPIGTVPCIQIKLRNDEPIGSVIGRVIDLEEERLVDDTLKLNSTDAETAIEEIYNRLTGPFVFVIDAGPVRRVYVDAMAQKSIVFDPEKKIIGSTAGTFLSEDEYRDRFRHALFEKLEIIGEGSFPSGLTAHVGVSKLLPNFYLDMNDWTEHRHWPADDLYSEKSDTELLNMINSVVSKQIAIMTEKYSVCMGLTAGADTRAVLAASRNYTDKIYFFTNNLSKGSMDVAVSLNLSKKFDLNHHLITGKEATEREMGEWVYRTGHCHGDVNRRYHPTIFQVADYDFMVGGLGPEVVKGSLYRKEDGEILDIDGDTLASRIGHPSTPETAAATDEWLRSVEGYPKHIQLDLAFTELKNSCWITPQHYASKQPNAFYPLVNRPCFRAFYSLSPERKATGKISRFLISEAWPELLSLPINSRGVWHDNADNVLKAFHSPRSVIRKLRKLGILR